MEVTKWPKLSIIMSRIGDSASVQAAARVNAEQASKRTTDRVNNDRGHSILATRASRGKANDSEETSTQRRCIVLWRKWRATVDEDGQYSFAVAL
jgi:hypothetical protein